MRIGDVGGGVGTAIPDLKERLAKLGVEPGYDVDTRQSEGTG